MIQTQLQLPPELAETKFLLRWASFQITTEGDLELAGTGLKEIEGRLKAIKAKQTELFGPLKRAIRDFEERVRDVTKPLEMISDSIRGKISAFWDARQKALEAEAAEKRRKEILEANEKAAQALDVAASLGSEESLKVAAQAEANAARIADKAVSVSQTVRTSEATVAQSQYWAWEVVNQTEVPREYLVLDEKKLNQIARKYDETPVAVPGISFSKKSRVVLKG